ncbi:MAG: pyridoxine 5'-phosphate synthase [Flavobacteriales bacterium]|jgi:pyridoxine 5-phosphate synthase|nr:pyridoxine 5'-phosphate synthase [Flavobacteriales bacterium]
MTQLSVNINKVATLRNARGGKVPDLLQVASDLQQMGAQGITIHPRPDERHIRYADARALPAVVTTELNIEGNPNPKFIDLVLEVQPHQVTLVPDGPDALTSNAGWDTQTHQAYLREIIDRFHAAGIRTSIFVDPDVEMVAAARDTGTDRIELYTESYAVDFPQNPEVAIAPFIAAAEKAQQCGLGLNAGHDLSLDNIAFFTQNIPGLLEVSIGHALISEALYLGFEKVIASYLQKLA